MKKELEAVPTELGSETAPLPITISIKRKSPKSSEGATLSLDADVAFIHEDLPHRPHKLYWRISQSTPLLRAENVVIEAKAASGEPVPGNGKHKERLPHLNPPAPYRIEESTPNQKTQTVGSPGLQNRPDGDYGWQYQVTLRFQSKEIDRIDPWTVIQKP